MRPGPAVLPAGRPPHEDAPVRRVRQGAFWIPGTPVQLDGRTYPAGPMYVSWQAPEVVVQPWPLVLVHGGGGQGTDWLGTPDGGPGWADRLVDAGWAVYVVDRPGHGRSGLHPAVLGATTLPFSYEDGIWLFAPPELADRQHAWPGGRAIGDPVLDQLLSAMGSMLLDTAAAHDRDGDALARLLDLLGPSVLLTHSAGAPSGWVAADRRPDLVRAIVSVEPIGPPFADSPGGATGLTHGLTATPVGIEPGTDGGPARWPALASIPVAVVTGEASVFSGVAPPVVDFLVGHGCPAELLALGEHGITGNGHGMMMEGNAPEVLALLTRWITEHAS
jgi:pimeloyl-ACP methyl ester carboxylesterase